MQKLVWLEEIESHGNLRSIQVDLEGVRHPVTLVREETLTRVMSVLWERWDMSGEQTTWREGIRVDGCVADKVGLDLAACPLLSRRGCSCECGLLGVMGGRKWAREMGRGDLT